VDAQSSAAPLAIRTLARTTQDAEDSQQEKTQRILSKKRSALMQETESAGSEDRPHGPDDDAAGSPLTVTDTGDAAEPGGTGSVPESGSVSPPTASRRTGPAGGARLAAFAAAGLLALAAGFGLAKLVDPPGPAALPSAIPSPASSGGVFVEDDNGTGQDNQTNILQSTAPGLVHIIRGGNAVGIGMVLTPSGKVLTTYQPSRSAGGLTAEYVLSGHTFQATVLGTDPAAGLALLQLEGGSGRAFPTLAVGNSDALVDDTYASKQISYHITGEVFDTAIGTNGTQAAVVLNTGLLVALNRTVTIDGKSRAGLMQSVLQTAPTTEIGGPLVNLNGQVIGITVASGGTGLKISGYAMPINQVLAIARQIDDKAQRTS
jgi:putative serine protease PepD